MADAAVAPLPTVQMKQSPPRLSPPCPCQ